MPKSVRPGSDQSALANLRQFKAEVFRVLAHPTRIHIIESLGESELSVSQIIERVGVEPANASQHLSVLRAKGLVTTRKDGNQVFYSLRDPFLKEVLASMRRYFQAHVEEAMETLRALEEGG